MQVRQRSINQSIASTTAIRLCTLSLVDGTSAACMIMYTHTTWPQRCWHLDRMQPRCSDSVAAYKAARDGRGAAGNQRADHADFELPDEGQRVAGHRCDVDDADHVVDRAAVHVHLAGAARMVTRAGACGRCGDQENGQSRRAGRRSRWCACGAGWRGRRTSRPAASPPRSPCRRPSRWRGGRA